MSLGALKATDFRDVLMMKTLPRGGRFACSVACAFLLVSTLTSAAVARPSGNAAVSTCEGDALNGHWWCENKPGIRVQWAGQTVGYLNSDTNWFTCRYEGDPTGGGGPHPNRWIYTLADTPHLGHGGWGFVKDSDVIDETNPLPRC
ncbi:MULTISPECIES: hypothetical protein [unclassified Streptomyces]|uniref:hypothetical protein n=1 Tax=unclassified Streptomyces TaxID=2593676 RepID=UPI0013B6393D|nr:hypothetical protein [Streptomyces sp. SID14446]NEB28450.1 hypothetical protein [Streptomyces sp. SID14446]